MADNAEGAIPFTGMQPPSGGPDGCFEFNPMLASDGPDDGSMLDVGAGGPAMVQPPDPLARDGISDVDVASISGVPNPGATGKDSLSGPDDVVILGG